MDISAVGNTKKKKVLDLQPKDKISEVVLSILTYQFVHDYTQNNI